MSPCNLPGCRLVCFWPQLMEESSSTHDAIAAKHFECNQLTLVWTDIDQCINQICRQAAQSCPLKPKSSKSLNPFCPTRYTFKSVCQISQKSACLWVVASSHSCSTVVASCQPSWGYCRVAMWVEHSFGTENGVQHGPEGVEAHFMSLRDGRPLSISMRGTKVS